MNNSILVAYKLKRDLRPVHVSNTIYTKVRRIPDTEQ
jgi:hypothetical protein